MEDALRRVPKHFLFRGNWWFTWLIGSHPVRVCNQNGHLQVFVDDSPHAVVSEALPSDWCGADWCGGSTEFMSQFQVGNNNLVLVYTFHTRAGLDVRDMVLRSPQGRIIAEFNRGVIRSLWQPEQELYPPEDTASDPENRSGVGRQFGLVGMLVESAVHDAQASHPPSRLTPLREGDGLQVVTSTGSVIPMRHASSVSAADRHDRDATRGGIICCKIVSAVISFCIGIALALWLASMR